MTTHNENLPHNGPRQNTADYWLDIFGDVDFPVHRAGLWKHARSRKADPLLLNRIKEMPEHSYKSMEEFRKAFGGRIDNHGNTH
jgi:hypothetical protein